MLFVAMLSMVMATVVAVPGGAAPVAAGEAPRPDTFAPAATATPYKSVSVPDGTAAAVAVDSTGMIVVAAHAGLYTYHPSGLYQRLVDLGEPLVAVAAAGDHLVVSSASRSWRLQAGTLQVQNEYARPLRFSSAAVAGDRLYAADALVDGQFATLSLTTGALTWWTAAGTTVHAIPNSTRALVSGSGVVSEYDTAATPPTLLTSQAVGPADGVSGVAADGAHALLHLGGARRRVPLPLGSLNGTDLSFGGIGPAYATAGSGGWQAFVGPEGTPAVHRVRFVRPDATVETATAQVASEAVHAAWNVDGTALAVLARPSPGTAALQLFAPPGSPRPVTAFSGAAGEYVGIAPTRVLDTRDGTGAPAAPLGPGAVLDVQLAGVGDIPASGVTAVAVNITAVGPTSPTYLSAFPTSGTVPFVSNVNAQPGDVRPNLAIVRLGTGGRISLLNAAGATHAVLDVQGYFSGRTGVAGGRYHPLVPARLLDTRSGAPMGPSGLVGLPVRGVGGVPPTATAVALTVTAVAPSAATYLTVYPSDVARPWASNLNVRRDETVANLVFARIGADGNVAIANETGVANVVVDVVGYWDTDRSTEAGRFIAFAAPFRWVDSRGGAGPIGPGRSVWVQVAGFPTEDPVVPLPADGAAAVVANLTATNPTAGGYVTAYPDTQATPPLASNLNVVAGQTAAVLTLVGYGSGGRINVFNAAGSTDVIVDLAGWFTSAAF
ncbi:MAG: hypothetical protein AB7Q92_13460 [Acidimicrobiia bacterium]